MCNSVLYNYLVVWNPDLWVDLAATLKLDAKQVISSNMEKILADIKNSPKITEVRIN